MRETNTKSRTGPDSFLSSRTGTHTLARTPNPAMDLLHLAQDAASHMLKHHTLPPVDMLRALLSKGLGYGIVAFAGVVKLPQIAALARSRSAAGLAPVSAELEQVAYAIAVRERERERERERGGRAGDERERGRESARRVPLPLSSILTPSPPPPHPPLSPLSLSPIRPPTACTPASPSPPSASPCSCWPRTPSCWA